MRGGVGATDADAAEEGWKAWLVCLGLGVKFFFWAIVGSCSFSGVSGDID